MSKRIHSSVGIAKDPAVLALEVEADRKAWFAKEPAAIDPADSGRDCDLGRGTHCQRIETETRDPRFASHCREVPARWQPRANPRSQQRWLTFVWNHANVIVACDFFTVVTATFRTLYVFVILEIATRR